MAAHPRTSCGQTLENTPIYSEHKIRFRLVVATRWSAGLPLGDLPLPRQLHPIQISAGDISGYRVAGVTYINAGSQQRSSIIYLYFLKR